MKHITETFEITASQGVMKRFKALLALLHHNSNFGHSNYFGMPLDGDGSESFQALGDYGTNTKGNRERIWETRYRQDDSFCTANFYGR